MSITEGPAPVNRPEQDTVARILDTLRTRTDCPDLEYSEQPVRLNGGYWAEIFSMSFSNPPAELTGRLVVRVMPDEALARKETIVQAQVASQGYPTPIVRLAGDADDRLQRAFIVMDRAPGSPLLSGLSAGAVIARFPQLAWRLPLLLADTMAELHSLDPAPVRSQFASEPPMAVPRVSEFLETLTASCQALGRTDLASAARRLADLRPPPAEEVICHGDLHPFNLLVDGDLVTVVDWTVALLAEPAYDVAFTWLLLTDAPLDAPPALRPPIRVAGWLIGRRFLRRYRRRSQMPVSEVSLRWHVGVHCLRALVEVAGWAQAGEIADHAGHPWLISGIAFAHRLGRLSGVRIDTADWPLVRPSR